MRSLFRRPQLPGDSARARIGLVVVEEECVQVDLRRSWQERWPDDTGGHTSRVGWLAAGIGRALGLEAGFVEQLAEAARLHDIGKLAIPPAILNKPGDLTPEERHTLRAHTLHGANLLAAGTGAVARLAQQIALSHHERWDGSGYPHGLAGDAIPLSARIVAVADVFDALVSRRVYKEAWPREVAIAEIARSTGRHFDPRVAAAFLQVVGRRPE